MVQVKIFGAYRYQQIEEEFNAWARGVNPYVVKTILDTASIPRSDSGHSLFFTMVIFYTAFNDSPEVFARPITSSPTRKIGGALNG